MVMITPHTHDVLFGRGAAIMGHPGNQRLRSMVEQHRKAFVEAAKRKDKRKIATDIIQEIQNLQPPARFLAEDPQGKAGGDRLKDGRVSIAPDIVQTSILNKAWVCVEPDKALTKVMHGLREKETGCGTDVGRQVEMQRQQKQLAEQEEKIRDPSETKSFEADSLTAQLPQLLIDKSTVADTSITDSTTMRLGVSPNDDIQPRNQLDQTESFEQILSETHIYSESENSNKKKDLAGGLSEPRIHRESVGSWQADGSGELDEELESFLYTFSSHHEDEIQLQELTMHEWIDQSKQTMGKSPKDKSEYVRPALSIARKLTECLIEAEKKELNGSGNLVPLASIVSGNVLIRAKVFDLIEGSNAPEIPQDIEYAWIMSCIGDNPETGGIMPRLVALGVVLYELFSGGEVPSLAVDAPSLNAPSTFSSLNSNEPNRIHRSKKKSLRHGVSGDEISECIGKIESMGVPLSLCALLENLLDCSNGDFCGDSAFTSFADVHLDLQLMLTDPIRFLDDIQTNPIPSLKICNKLYGREVEIERVETSYQQLLDGTCSGVIISGGAGVGKSKLAMHVGELTSEAGGYFVGAKYEQNNHVNPLSAIGSAFNALCDLFARDATPSQLISVDEALGNALGSQVTVLAAVLPSLIKLMPSHMGIDSSSSCIDFRLSLRFLFTELLRVISSHSRSISLFFDDIQWADPASLLLIGTLISSVEGSRCVFFTCCYRDNEMSDNSPFYNWMSSITGPFITTIKLENMAEVGVNNLVSDTLHLSPRIIRPLSSVLHHKTRGNPLFLRQLIESLKDQGHIYVKLNQPRWAWDLNKIMDLKISDDVVALLIKEMQRLPADLQMILKVASCMGSCVKYSVLGILSRDLDLDLQIVLQQLSEKSFMHNDSAVSSFRFVHDKIQQAAAELMSEQERRELHMRLGLAISSHILDDDQGNDEVFFAAVNQVNCGGLGSLSDPSKRGKFASLNLKAGKRAVAFSDFNAALKLFEHGVSFLPTDSWVTHYDLSVDLFDAAAEAACTTNNRSALTLYSDQLIAHAKCFDDKLNCLYSVTKTLRQANLLQESMQSSFNIIQQCGEELPLPMGNEKLNNEMQIMNNILKASSDESILNMGETKSRKIVILLKTYALLANMLMFTEPSLKGAVSLRMVDLTIKSGLTSVCPLAFAYYGGTLASMGNDHMSEASRLGRIALKLSEKSESSIYKSSVICIVYFTISWASCPLQAIAEAHLAGHQAGMQAGDFLFSVMNELIFFQDNFLTGHSLTIVRRQFRDFILKMQSKDIQPAVGRSNSILYHLHAAVLQDGEHLLNEEYVDGVPGLGHVFDKIDTTVSLLIKNLCVQRAFLFRRFDDVSFGSNNILDLISKEKHQLRPVLLMGIFFEGLVSFQLARRTSDETKTKWIGKGVSALAKMQCWTNHCEWNFENKMLLLKAEKMYTLGQFDQAEELYTRSIRSAHDHKFIHEVAIASENAGDLFYERRVFSKSVALYKYSIKCYKEWGALAVATRVESDMQRKFGPGIAQFESIEDFPESFLVPQQQQGSSKKSLEF